MIWAAAGPSSAAGDDSASQAGSQRLHELERVRDTRRIGLALSGGGSKAAPFAMGVLAGLSETHVLDGISAISSVSGGSYAALEYFSRVLASYDGKFVDRTIEDSFRDCVPSVRRYRYPDGSEDKEGWRPDRPYGLCPERPHEGLYFNTENGALKGDPLQFASHIRGYQDLLEGHYSYSGTQSKDGKVNVVWPTMKLLFMNSIVLGVPNFLANSLFDWRVDLSPSRAAYANGIVRTYGRDPTSLAGITEEKDLPVERPHGDPNSAGRLTFSNLRNVYEKSHFDCSETFRNRHLCNLPFWIINATAGSTPSSLALTDRTAFTGEKNGFELTPYGYGAEAFGFADWGRRDLEPHLSVRDAVTASGAFFDSQQRSVGGNVFGPLLNLGLHLVNLDWGIDVANYNQTRTQYDNRRFFHAILPWPLYLPHFRAGTPDGLYIHLSDGGQSENIGLMPLLRRGLTDIIVADAAADEKYDLRDFCALNHQLETSSQPRHIEIDDIEGFPERCGTREKDPYGLMTGLPSPVLRGRICQSDARGCSDVSAVARLYIVKPALNRYAHGNGPSLDSDVAQVMVGFPDTVGTLTFESCRGVLPRFHGRLS